MGRTLRKRKQSRKKLKCYPICDTNYTNLIHWLCAKSWTPTCNLIATNFSDIGRGFMAKKYIPEGATLVKIPADCLITVETVAENLTQIDWIFNHGDSFTTHDALAIFLVWQKHLGVKSAWKEYVEYLPRKFTCPLYCSSSRAKTWLLAPELAEELQMQTDKLERANASLMECFKNHKNCCPHCGDNLSDVFSAKVFKWAWFAVNTRCVYVAPNVVSQNCIKLADNASAALAPYLDLFNHHPEAQVESGVCEENGFYYIKTKKEIRRYQQAFIDYGSHSNRTLFMDYGFIVPNNTHDSVKVSLNDITVCVERVKKLDKILVDKRVGFLVEEKLAEKMCFTGDGLSWSGSACIYALLCPPNMSTNAIRKDIFRATSVSERWDVKRVSKLLVDKKIDEMESYMMALDGFVNDEEYCKNMGESEKNCMNTAYELLRIYLHLLENSKDCMNNNSNDDSSS